MSDPILNFHQVHRNYYAGDEVLQGVSFTVNPGEVVGLLGRNGAGKTTLLHCAMGMIRPQAGSVRVFGQDPLLEPVAVKSRTGFVSEKQDFPGHLRAGHLLDLCRAHYPTWDTDFESDLRERLDINDRQRLSNLSLGQSRQVALLCAVAHRPELLLLDEPAGGLDPAARREFLEAAIGLLADGGTTVLFSSHHMQDVERLAHRVVMIDQGKVLLDRELDELKERSCVARLESSDRVRASLEDIQSCLRVRERRGMLEAVLSVAPAEGRQLLRERLQLEAECTAVSLEDLFVTLVGHAS